MRIRHRAAIYLTRRGDRGVEVLAFREPNGTLQVPAGGVEPGETPTQAAVREAGEEAGVAVAAPARPVHVEVGRYSGIEVWKVTHFHVADAPPGLPEAWDHTVTAPGVEQGRLHRCHWLPAARLDRLAAGLGVAAHVLLPQHPPPAPAVAVRDAAADDLSFIAGLRDLAVRETTAIYTDRPSDPAVIRGWLDAGPRHPVLIAEADGEPLGYGVLRPFDALDGYAATAEDSVYVAPHAHRRGVGSALLGALLGRGRAAGLRSVVARIDLAQTASLGLHLRHGFRPAGVLRGAGTKFGRPLDVAYLQRTLTP